MCVCVCGGGGGGVRACVSVVGGGGGVVDVVAASLLLLFLGGMGMGLRGLFGRITPEDLTWVSKSRFVSLFYLPLPIM